MGTIRLNFVGMMIRLPLYLVIASCANAFSRASMLELWVAGQDVLVSRLEVGRVEARRLDELQCRLNGLLVGSAPAEFLRDPGDQVPVGAVRFRVSQDRGIWTPALASFSLNCSAFRPRIGYSPSSPTAGSPCAT